MRKLCAIALLAFVVLFGRTWACSICMYTIDGRSYFCGNEDWSARDPAFMTVPAARGDYGYLILGWASYLPGYAQAGVNSEGLCFDWAMVPAGKYVSRPGAKELSIDFPVEALRRCKDVSEVLRFIEGAEIPHVAEEHLMFADKGGRSCVLEYGREGLRVIAKEGSSQFITNFLLSEPSRGGYPCARYSRMEAFFKEGGDRSGELVNLLDSVHQEGSFPTVYSYIFDLKLGKVRLFYNRDFKRSRDCELSSLLREAALSAIAP